MNATRDIPPEERLIASPTMCEHVNVAEYGSELISRSQAKRLVARLENFTEVELDFGGVNVVGQGFVDEVFRVWASGHPLTKLSPSRMNPGVRFMVERGFSR